MSHFLKILLIIYVFQWGEIQAQHGIWHQLGAEDGLSDPNVTSFAKSFDGELYIGTSVGLCKYDGFHFYPVAFPAELKINPYVNSLIADKKSIYIGLRNGLLKRNLRTEEISFIRLNDALGGGNDLCFNVDSSLLFATSLEGIHCIDITNNGFRQKDSIVFSGMPRIRIMNDTTLTVMHHNKFIQITGHQRKLLLMDKNIIDALWWPKEKCWIVCKADGLYTYHEDDRLLIKLNSTENAYIHEDRILYLDGENIWVRTSHGFGMLSSLEATELLFFTKDSDNPSQVTSTFAQAFYKDDTQTLWVGSGGSGISYLTKSGNSISFISNRLLNVDHIWSINPISENDKILLGTDQGILSAKLTGNKFEKYRLIKAQEIGRFSVSTIADLNNQNYLVSAINSGLWLLEKNTFRLNSLKKLNKQIESLYYYGIQTVSKDRLIIMTQKNAHLFDKKRGIISSFPQPKYSNYSVYSALEDSSGNFFLGGGFGLQIFDSLQRQLHYFRHNADSAGGLCSNVIMFIYELSKGNFLLGTMGGGMCSYNSTTNVFTKVKLITDPVNIFGIMPVDKANLLITTSNGLCKYNWKTKKSIMLNSANVLPFNDFNQAAYFVNENNAYAAGEKGVILLKKKQIETLFKHSDEIVVWNGNQQIDQIQLKPGHSNLSLRFSLKSLFPAKEIVFQHKISELDDDWHPLSAGQNTLDINYLQPGEYHLEISIKDPTGFIQTNHQEIIVQVLPYYYQTTWFKALIIIVLLIGVVFIVRYLTSIRLKWKLNQLQAEQKIMLERSRISRELHDSLGSQLTYLISGLETTEVLLKRKNIEKTEKNLDSLQNAARESMQQLRDSIWALHPGKMTIQSFINQFDQWHKKLSEPFEKLQISFTVDNISDFDIDPINGLNLFRIMQEAVHNILKHANASFIETKIQDAGNELNITISDDGIGFDNAQPEGNGITSMKQRAGSLNARITIQSQKDKGTIIRIVLNKNTLKGE
jgi:signal transduction histidine kinase/ligand-binding sensor domain-containing protein